ncbi:MAG: hypothetical protein WA323_22795 [Candidatus Nitrosopolaris sp.]
MNIIIFGELLTIVEIISNLLPAFKSKGEVRVFTRSTPAPAAFGFDFVVEDWECAYRSCPSGKPRIVKTTSMTSADKTTLWFVL